MGKRKSSKENKHSCTHKSANEEIDEKIIIESKLDVKNMEFFLDKNVCVFSMLHVIKGCLITGCITTSILYLGNYVCFRNESSGQPLTFYPIAMLTIAMFVAIQYILYGCGCQEENHRILAIVDMVLTIILAFIATAATVMTTINCNPSNAGTAATVAMGYIISAILALSAIVSYMKHIRRKKAASVKTLPQENNHEPITADNF